MISGLTDEQQKWLDAHIATGEFASVDDAVRHLIEARMVEEELDDLAWAKPLVDEALAEAERGEGISLEEHERRMEAYMETLRRRSQS